MSLPTLPTFANISVAELLWYSSHPFSGHPFKHLLITVNPRGDAIDYLSFVGHVLKLAENHRVAVVDLTSRVEARFPPCWLELVIHDLIEHQVFVNVDDAAEQRYIEAHSNATPEKKRYFSYLSKMTPDEVLNLTTKRCDCDIPRGRTDQFLGFQIQHFKIDSKIVFKHLIDQHPQGIPVNIKDKIVQRILGTARSHRVVFVELMGRLECQYPHGWLDPLVDDLIAHQIFVDTNDEGRKYLDRPYKYPYFHLGRGTTKEQDIFDLTATRAAFILKH